MEESPDDKIHKTFKDDSLSNIFEAKNEYLATPEWLTASSLAVSAINPRLETFVGIDAPNPFSSDRFTNVSLLQTMADEASQIQVESTRIGLSDFASIDLTPKILTEFEPQNNIHEELSDHEKKIRLLDVKTKKLENKISKVSTQVKKLSKKTNDIRNDVYDTGDYLAKKFRNLEADVDVLTSLVEDDED